MISNLKHWSIYRKIERDGIKAIAKEDSEFNFLLHAIQGYAINSSKRLIHGSCAEFLDVPHKIPLTKEAAEYGVSAHRLLICVFMEDLWNIRIIEKLPTEWNENKSLVSMLRGSESAGMKETFIDQLLSVFYLHLGYIFRTGSKRKSEAGFAGLYSFKYYTLGTIKGNLAMLAPEIHRLTDLGKFDGPNNKALSERTGEISWSLVNEFGKCKTFVDSRKITHLDKIATVPVKYVLDPPGTDKRNNKPVEEMHTVEQFNLLNSKMQTISITFIYQDRTESRMDTDPNWIAVSEGYSKTFDYLVSRFS